MSRQNDIYILGTGMVTPHGEQHEALPAAVDHAVESKTVTDTTGLTKYIAKRSLRRIDHFSRMALHASCLALDDAGLWGNDLENTGIALSSGYGAAQTTFNFLESFLNDGDRLASPTHFSNGLHNAASAYIAMQSKAQGPCICTSNIGLGPAYSLATAVHWLQQGIVDYALVGGVDEYSQVIVHYFTRFQTEDENMLIQPECKAGEGAAFLVLGTKPATEHAPCILSDIAIDHYATVAEAPRQEPLFISPLGLATQHEVYDSFTNAQSITNLLPVLGSHPSALAFSAVQAARSVLSVSTTTASAFALDPSNNAALISFKS